MRQVFVVAGESWLLSLVGNLHRAAPGHHGLSGLIEKDVINTSAGADGLSLNAFTKHGQKVMLGGDGFVL